MTHNLSNNFTGYVSLTDLTIQADLYRAQWAFTPILRIVVCIMAFITNGGVLLLFLTQQTLLISSFNVYLINLLTCNTLYAALQNPPDVVNMLYPGWFLGSDYCSFYLYLSWTLESGIRWCHSLITTNRLWAVLWPNSYRLYHSTRTAVIIVLSTWLFMHCVLLPGMIRDAMFFRSPLIINPCYPNTNAQRAWGITMQVLFFSLHLVIVIFAYPVIYWKRRQRTGPVEQLPMKENTENSVKTADASLATRREVISGPPEVIVRQLQQATKRPSNAFRVLTLLTMSVAICWTPLTIYYTVSVFLPDGLDIPIYNHVAYVLLSFQSTLDPLLFIAALPDLREAVRRCFRQLG